MRVSSRLAIIIVCLSFVGISVEDIVDISLFDLKEGVIFRVRHLGTE